MIAHRLFVAWICVLAFAGSAFSLERPDACRCATWQLRQGVGDDAWSGAASPGPLPCSGTPVGPPPSPSVGTSWDWYIWRLNGFPQADLKSCTVRGMGANCYVVVEDSQWNVNIDQAQVDTIINHFENASIGTFPNQGIWDLDTAHFGDPPDDLDQDPRVYILYYDFDVSSDGFFWSFDQQCDGATSFSSNECDVVYMNCSDFNPAGSYLLAVLAHEFEHLIHYNYDTNEAGWVDEGLAELAMWLYGNPDVISQFNFNPDRTLTSFNGNYYDYVKSYLFTLYFYERYGGQASVTALVQEPGNGIAGYDAVLDSFSYVEDFEDLFSDWVVANYLDDVSVGDGRFGYLGETLPAFSPFATHSAYPVGPNAAVVQYWAADYVRFLNGSSLHVTFDGSDNNRFAARAMLLDPVTPTEVIDMTLSASQTDTLGLPQVGSTHEEVVMVYAGIQGSGTKTYEYGAGTDLVAVPSGPSLPALSLRTERIAPDRAALAFEIPSELAGVQARLDVYDASGRLARRLLDGNAVPGPHRLAWDGRDDHGARVGSGIYLARLRVGRERVTARLNILR